MTTYIAYFVAAWAMGFVLGFKYRMIKTAIHAAT